MNTHQKTVVITGANSGIGRAAAMSLAGQGYSVITICRNKAEGDKLVEELKKMNLSIQAENMVADLGDFESIKDAVSIILSKYPCIDRLINNAGYFPMKIEYVNDIEKTFYASHLGHMLLTQLLVPALERSPEARIINVSSGLHARGKVARFFVRTSDLNPMWAYADAKFANILFTMALAKKLPKNITTYSLHPGVVRTNFGKNVTGFLKVMINIFQPFFLTPEKGALTTLFLVNQNIDKLRSYSGRCFAKEKVLGIKNAEATDENATWVWNKSMQVLRAYL